MNIKWVGHPSDKKYRFQYLDVEYKDGWADATKYYPFEYDLCYLMLENGKICKGWKTSGGWDGKHIDDNSKIKMWKRLEKWSFS